MGLYVHMHTYMYECMNTHVVYMYICIYICMQACLNVYTSMYVCM